ncbi:MAG: prepilin-type N-terminal cleavage/methylation domain-containing protein [Luteolibacter sp.]
MRFSSHHFRGFTLVELMFSMVIGTIVLLLAAHMLGASGDGYERVGGNVAAEREGRAAITQLSADLSTGNYNEDDVIAQSTVSWPKDKLGFLCLQPSQAQTNEGHIGDLCSVYYYIKDLTMGGKIVRCLMRGFHESRDTFNALRDDSIPSLFKERSDIDEPVAFGVISFSVHPRSRDTTGKWIDWVTSDAAGPEAFDIHLVIARRDLMGKLKTSADWDGSGNLLGAPDKAGRNPNLEIYETTIRFGNHGKS